MNDYIFNASYMYSPPTQRRCRGRGNKIAVGKVVKAKVGELEEEVREGFSRRLRNDLTVFFQGLSGKKRFLVRFQYG